jgi:putative FmdB family regulatory protein
MPIYEYRCDRCHQDFSCLFIHPPKKGEMKCKYCKSKRVKRLLSSFALHQTEESRLAQIDTSKPRRDDYYKDSRNVGLWAKKRMREMGVDLGPKMDEIVEKGRTGEILKDSHCCPK